MAFVYYDEIFSQVFTALERILVEIISSAPKRSKFWNLIDVCSVHLRGRRWYCSPGHRGVMCFNIWALGVMEYRCLHPSRRQRRTKLIGRAGRGFPLPFAGRRRLAQTTENE